MFKPLSIHIKNITTHKDTYFEFHQSDSILVNGENLDDKGQKGNGAGKSGINEAVSLAIAGKTIRNVPMKELVSDNETQGEITLVLYNSIRDKNLNIKRTIYSNTKTQECVINYDGEKPIVKGNVLQYSDWIFNEIGISEDDFFSFYLITKENYKPFFSMTDVPKKTIINRFSGANEIDKVDPFIKNDISKKESEKIEIDKKIAVENTRVEMYENQLSELTIDETEVEDKKNEVLSELEEIEKAIELNLQTKEQSEENIKKLEKDITKFKNIYTVQVEEKKLEKVKISDEILLKKQEIKNVEKKYENEIFEKKTEIREVEKKYEDLISKKKSGINEIEITYKQLIDKIKTDIDSSKEDLNIFNSELNTVKQTISKLTNKLVSSITCPECSHEFNLQEVEFDVEKCRNETIPEHEEEKRLFEQEILTYQNDIDTNVLKIKPLEVERENKIKVIKLQITELENKSNSESEDIKDIIKDIEDKITSECRNIKSVINSLELTEQTIQREINELLTLENDENKKLQGFKLQVQSEEYKTKQCENNSKQLDLEFSQLEKKLLSIGIVDIEKVSETENSINIVKKKVKELTEQQQEITDELLRLNTWLLNFKKFKSFLANRSISNITDYTNLFLQKIGSDLSINVEGYRTLSDGKIKEELSTMVLRNGLTVGRYGRFSAGERVRIDFSNILALQEICNLNAKVGLDLLLIDEVLDSCDSTGLGCMIEGTSDLKKTIMIISQNEIKGNNKIKIIKENGVSRIV